MMQPLTWHERYLLSQMLLNPDQNKITRTPVYRYSIKRGDEYTFRGYSRSRFKSESRLPESSFTKFETLGLIENTGEVVTNFLKQPMPDAARYRISDAGVALVEAWLDADRPEKQAAVNV